MSVALPVPAPFYAALQMCHPDNLPGWLSDATRRCATAAAPLQLDEHQVEELAPLLTASTWRECQQAAPDDSPFAESFARACEETLMLLERASI
ncbi:hypothetical protein ACFV2X_54560 [Streptomyces sp. NPDC059679]|uniref:hypothetical protein n=1 Tax=Streptomyces sp. NPDC059679 TaxID=3346903 RepID=UPI00367D8EB5